MIQIQGDRIGPRNRFVRRNIDQAMSTQTTNRHDKLMKIELGGWPLLVVFRGVNLS